MRRLLRIDETFVREALENFVEQLLDGLIVHGAGILQHLAQFVAHGVFGEQVPFLQGAKDGLAKRIHGAFAVHLAHAVELRLETALQEKIAETPHEVVQIDSVSGLADVFSVADEFHCRRPR